MKKVIISTIIFSLTFLFSASVFAVPNYKLDIAFVPSAYTDLASFQADASRMQQFLLTLEPFRSRLNDLQFHVLNKIFDLHCQNIIDLQNPLKPLDICRDPSTIKKELSAASIPYDKIVILSNGVLGGHADRSGDFAVVATQGIGSEKTFAHEFGHLLGLFDEYETGRNSALDLERAKGKSSVANCSTVSSCPDWKTISGSSCLPGCDRSEWFRSSQNSLMKDASTASSFNLVSQQLLSKRIDEYTKDFNAPLVSILKPQEGEAFRGGIGTPDKGIVDSLFEITVNASDESFVSRIELMIDQRMVESKELGRDVLEALPTSYYSFFWNSEQSAFGSKHTVSARAYDTAGNSTTSKTVTFTIESQLEYLRGYPKALIPEKTPEKKAEEKIPEFKNPEFPAPPEFTEEQLKKFEEEEKRLRTPPPPPPGIPEQVLTIPPPPGVDIKTWKKVLKQKERKQKLLEKKKARQKKLMEEHKAKLKKKKA